MVEFIGKVLYGGFIRLINQLSSSSDRDKNKSEIIIQSSIKDKLSIEIIDKNDNAQFYNIGNYNQNYNYCQLNNDYNYNQNLNIYGKPQNKNTIKYNCQNNHNQVFKGDNNYIQNIG